jgi:hypothetical protein
LFFFIKKKKKMDNQAARGIKAREMETMNRGVFLSITSGCAVAEVQVGLDLQLNNSPPAHFKFP